ncbi:hypothetical protein OHA09_34605 [Streptomyces longwoodensis]|uniref:hypothetical protein n=1 Tax=Streptomyces longwoodensis TaxID=68231 RepID=UPI002E816C26|nr:hypothetical protein [Streptomyces longwoodensis]WUC62738.1 hypothetical protein OHA09_34605 [Streptomyces longwoodensis]
MGPGDAGECAGLRPLDADRAEAGPCPLAPAVGRRGRPARAASCGGAECGDRAGRAGSKPSRKLTGAIDLGEENLPFYDRPAEGLIVTTEQSWSAQGVTLGRLLHSLALAPGESTRVAVVDWQRTTRATGTEAAGENEAMSATSDQNRSISEVANSIAREEQYGDSVGFQSSQSSSSGGSIGVAFFGLGAGGNWSKSSSTGTATSVSRSTGVKSGRDRASRAQNLDTAGMGACQAKFTPLVAMPDPNGLQAVQAMTTANLFRDMSGLATMGQVLTKGIEAAATNDKAAGERAQEALKTATEHLQKMTRIAVGAASKAVPAVTGGGGNVSAFGGMLNQGGKADPPKPAPASASGSSPASGTCPSTCAHPVTGPVADFTVDPAG